MPFKTRVWSAGKLLLLGGALLLTYVLFAAAAMRLALKTREVEVPSLAGHHVNEAPTAVAGREGNPRGAGARATVMPSLIGESERTAELRLQQEGLKLVAASEVRSADYASGAVVAQ